jgi:hypothetical protein
MVDMLWRRSDIFPPYILTNLINKRHLVCLNLLRVLTNFHSKNVAKMQKKTESQLTNFINDPQRYFRLKKRA